MTTFLVKRGRAARTGKSHAHIARIGVSGQIIGAWCREVVDGNWISSNVPWGLKQCKHCLRVYWIAVEAEKVSK